MSCKHCGGRMMYNGLDVEWRCLLCARPRASKMRTPSENPTGRSAFRRKWDVPFEYTRLDCGT